MFTLRNCALILSVASASLLLQSCASSGDRINNDLFQGKAFFKQAEYHKAFVKLQPVAVAGNPDAEYAVGFMYFYGKGVAENQAMAKYWMEKAAAQGQVSAKNALEKIGQGGKEEAQTQDDKAADTQEQGDKPADAQGQ